MGLFGPTNEELRLQAMLNDTQAQLASANEELERAGENQRRLLAVADGDADTIRGLREELNDNAIANRVAAYVINVLSQMEANGEIDFGAEATAREVVKERTIAQATASLTNLLLDTEYARLVAELDPEIIDTIRRQLIETFEHDGTFARIRNDVMRNTRKMIINEELANARAQAEQNTNTPEALSAIRAELETDPDFIEQIAAIRATAREKAMQAQKMELKRTAPDIAEQEIAAGKDAALKEFMKAWSSTNDGQQKIARLKRELNKAVAEMGEQEILKETHDATLLALRTQREQQIARDLEAEILLSDFTDGGIDTTKIPVGSRIELTLGEVVEREDRYYDKSYGGERHGKIKIIEGKRQLNLTAQDSGKFIVNFDSLANSKSVYEKVVAIPVGTILRLGRQKIDLNAVTLDDRIVYGVPLFYDTDDTDPEIMSMMLKICAVKLNHIYAILPEIKKIEHVDGTTEDLNKPKQS